MHCFAINLVRDAEIEEYLYNISNSIFHSANISPNSVNFYLVKENSINAFVYGGQNIFINTGLIQHSHTPNMLQGVIAHELGHIMGAHLVKMQPQISKAMATYALATLLGVGILASDSSTSNGNAAIASTMLGQHIAERQFLSFSRSQESEADRYALKFLSKSNISTNGMLQLFNKLETMQKLYTKEIDQYSTTHPLSQKRHSYFAHNPIKGLPLPKKLLEDHFFIQAKILAYSPTQSFHTNAKTITSHPIYSLYYLAYKNILESNQNKALTHIQKLLQLQPKNPFFHETASIIYQKLKQNHKAKHHFQQAINLAPQNLFLKHEYASFLIKNFNKPSTINQAIFLLEQLKNTKESSPALYQNLQFAYKKLKMENYYLISSLEEFALFEDIKNLEKKEKLQKLVEKLKQKLKDNPNPNISQRLQRIQKLHE